MEQLAVVVVGYTQILRIAGSVHNFGLDRVQLRGQQLPGEMRTCITGAGQILHQFHCVAKGIAV